MSDTTLLKALPPIFEHSMQFNISFLKRFQTTSTHQFETDYTFSPIF